MITKLPLEEAYDGDLIEAVYDIDEMITDMVHFMHRRIAYEDWPEEYRIFDEMMAITEAYRKRKIEAEDEA